MPTYLYRRPDGTVFEALQRITDAPLATDPESGEPVERVITGGAGLQFKGTGFYLTDYARAGTDSKRKGSASEGSGGSNATSDAKSETSSGESSGSKAAKGASTESAGTGTSKPSGPETRGD